MHPDEAYPARWTGRLAACGMTVGCVMMVCGCSVLSGSDTASNPRSGGDGGRQPRLTPAELIGQRLIVRIKGTAPSAPLLARIRQGQIGGVILFSANTRSPAQVRALVRRLQAAADAAGRPPLLIATDQEGGAVRRLPWAPPAPPPAMLAAGGPAVAEATGRATGRALAAVGINVDLAPVADVPRGRSFLRASGRTWGDDPDTVARLATAFAQGLGEAGVIAAVKHFPGLGRAPQTTDRVVVDIAAARDELRADLLPFRAAIDAGVPMVMLSNATYPAYGPAPAGWEPAVAVGLLRRDLGFAGVSITDSLDGAAHARGITPVPLALQAAAAGVDLILITGSGATSQGVFSALRRAARDGVLDRASLEASYRRIARLKQKL